MAYRVLRLRKAISDGNAMETEEQMIRRVGQHIFGQLALELPPRELEILLSLWVKYRDDMEADRGAAA